MHPSSSIVLAEIEVQPAAQLVLGQEGYAIDVDEASNVKEVRETLGPISNINVKRSKHNRGYNPELTAAAKKPRIQSGPLIKEGGSSSSSSSYVPSNDGDEELNLPHVIVEKQSDGGQYVVASRAPSSPLAREHVSVEDSDEDSGLTLAQLLAYHKAKAFWDESSQAGPSQPTKQQCKSSSPSQSEHSSSSSSSTEFDDPSVVDFTAKDASESLHSEDQEIEKNVEANAEQNVEADAEKDVISSDEIFDSIFELSAAFSPIFYTCAPSVRYKSLIDRKLVEEKS